MKSEKIDGMKSRFCFFWIHSYNGQVGTECLFKYVSLNTLCIFCSYALPPFSFAEPICKRFVCLFFVSMYMFSLVLYMFSFYFVVLSCMYVGCTCTYNKLGCISLNLIAKKKKAFRFQRCREDECRAPTEPLQPLKVYIFEKWFP